MTPPARKVKVRIAALVNDLGEWSAIGSYFYKDDKESMRLVEHSMPIAGKLNEVSIKITMMAFIQFERLDAAEKMREACARISDDRVPDEISSRIRSLSVEEVLK